MSSHHTKAFFIRHYNQKQAAKERKQLREYERAEKNNRLQEYYAALRDERDMETIAWTCICLLYFIGIIVSLAFWDTLTRLFNG